MITAKSKNWLRALEEKLSDVYSEADSYKLSDSKADDESSSETSGSEMETTAFEEFVKEFTDSSEIFRLLACNFADELERVGNEISQNPPKIIPTALTNEPEYQFGVTIRDKLPHAEAYLVQRLAKECWRLHQSIVYGLQKRDEREVQLKSNITVSASDEGYKTASNQRTIIVPSLIDGLPQKAVIPVPNFAQYALSIASSAAVNSSDRPTLPRLPEGTEFGSAFICQICSTLQTSINSPKDWKEHVYADLQPYFCTFEKCALKAAERGTSVLRFSSRHDWWQHEIRHRLTRRYKCILEGCRVLVESDELFMNHIETRHPDLKGNDRNLIISECSKDDWQLDESLLRCPFCKVHREGRKSKLVQHIAHHLEDQALIVFRIANGNGEEDKYEEVSDQNSHKSLSDTENTIASNDSDDGVVRCICGFEDDDSFIIQCDGCQKWQHGVCMRLSEKEIPDLWMCHICRPGRFNQVDQIRAYKKQKKRREQESRTQPKKPAPLFETDTKDSRSPESVPPRRAKTGYNPSRDSAGRSLFFKACSKGHRKEAEMLLGDDVEPLFEADNAGYLPIHAAALNGHTAVVRFLISNGSPVDHPAKDLSTPLLDAVENMHRDVVFVLLEAGADPRKRNENGQNALDVVVSLRKNFPENEKDYAVIEKLLQAATAKGSKSYSNDETPRATVAVETIDRGGRQKLCDASRRGDMEMVGQLLEQGVAPDIKSVTLAAEAGHINVLNFLLAFGGDSDPDPTVVARGKTPLLATIGSGNLNILKLLLNSETMKDPCRVDNEGRTYTDIARERAGLNWEEEVEILQRAYDDAVSKTKKSRKDKRKPERPLKLTTSS